MINYIDTNKLQKITPEPYEIRETAAEKINDYEKSKGNEVVSREYSKEYTSEKFRFERVLILKN